MKMLPTNELRFVERTITDLRKLEQPQRKERILQQRWEEEWRTADGAPLKEVGEPIASEWRDVPVFRETQ